jgi:NADH dehydrogenase
MSTPRPSEHARRDAPDLHLVTGAFGFTGRHITRLLLDRGLRVRTLTGHPDRPNPFGDQVEVAPYRFDDPEAMARSLAGVRVLYNTYWIRFAHGALTFDRAVASSRALFAAARAAGVERVVHVSITHPDATSPLPYFRGKALVEQALIESGLSHAILRPTVLFGAGDILINNIAWLLRRLPVFGIFGDGRYRMQPVFVEDLAALAVAQGESRGNVVLDAVGPETYAYEDLVRLVRDRLGRRTRLIHVPPSLGLVASRLAGPLLHDVVITRDEIVGLMNSLLVSSNPPTCPTRFREWLDQHAEELGREYASEVRRHY